MTTSVDLVKLYVSEKNFRRRSCVSLKVYCCSNGKRASLEDDPSILDKITLAPSNFLVELLVDGMTSLGVLLRSAGFFSCLYLPVVRREVTILSYPRYSD